MKRGWISSLAGLLMALLLIPGAAGASCIALSPEQQAAGASVIVYGKIERVAHPPAGGTHVTVATERIYKGNPPNPLLIYSQSGPTMMTSVDYQMMEGEEHTLYLQTGEDGSFYRTNACMGSHSGEPTATELQVLGQGEAAPAPSAQPPQGSESSGFPIRMAIPIIAAVVSAGAILFVIFWPRRRKHG